MAVITSHLLVIELIIKYLILNGHLSENYLKHSSLNKLTFNQFNGGLMKESKEGIFQYKCKDKIMLSVDQATKLRSCIFRRLPANNFLKPVQNCDDFKSDISYCFHDLNDVDSTPSCTELLDKLVNDVVEHLRMQLSFNCKFVKIQQTITYTDHHKGTKKLRKKRQENSDCDARLKSSLQCYKIELKRFKSGLEIQTQNDPGCRLIENIIKDCDKQLCAPSSHLSNARTYGAYVHTIVPEFDVERCGIF